MFVIAVVLAALLILDVAAWYWGADSRDAGDSPKWARRESWTRMW